MTLAASLSFFFNDTATTEIYTLSLHDALPISRALLNSPELILADEPTGNLDPQTSNEIMRLLLKICQENRAVIMATHNYNLIHKFPGRVVKCEEGSIVDSNNKVN